MDLALHKVGIHDIACQQIQLLYACLAAGQYRPAEPRRVVARNCCYAVMGLFARLKRLGLNSTPRTEEQPWLIDRGFRDTQSPQNRFLQMRLDELIATVKGIGLSTPDLARLVGHDLKPLLDAICALATTPQEAATVLDRVLRDVVKHHHHGITWGDRLLTLDKSAEFREDPVFRKALEGADSSTGANQYESPDGICWRYNTLIWAAKTCLALPGDFVECGVFRGDMTWMITQMVDVQSAGKRFYLYDTFAGLPPKYSSEDDFPGSPQFFHFIDREYRAPDIEDRVRQRFHDKPFITVTKGIVPDVLSEVAPDRIAFLHLDMNSPRAEEAALEVLFDRISQGGMIIYDDYGWKQYHKQKESADRAMAKRGHVILELPTGQGLVVKS